LKKSGIGEMAEFLDVFRFIADALGIVGFGMDNFKAPDNSASASITVVVGLDYSGCLNNAGGE
jgi:hypothetical protein